MKLSFVRVLSVVGALLMLAAACSGDDGAVGVQDARFRVATDTLGAGYLTITNTTGDDVTLTAATALDVAGIDRIELHESSANDDGTMSMEQRPEGFVVPAGGSITLEPGGKHLMIFGEAPREDMTVLLEIGDATIEVVATYDAAASASAPMDMDGDAMDMDDDTMSDEGDS